MANSNVAQAEDAVVSLTMCDELVQEATDKIEVMAIAAKNMLALDAQSLLVVASLLDSIIHLAGTVQNEVNAHAEQYDANYRGDETSHVFRGKLWAQHHALYGHRPAPWDGHKQAPAQ